MSNKNNIFVIVDVQNDFITGALPNNEAQVAVPKIVEKIKDLSKDTIIISTFDTHHENYLETHEGKYLPIPHCIQFTEGWEQPEVIKKVILESNCKIAYGITKETFSGGERIRDFLFKNQGITAENIGTIQICGFCTDICVVSTALSLRAIYPEAEIEILSDCCAGVTVNLHHAALDVMRSCQCKIV